VEIPITLLFSDIRGSTAMGERMRPADFHAFLDRFYRLASDSIVAHDGIVDKVVGDEVIGLFFGGITGPRHAAAAVASAIDLAGRAARASTTAVAIPAGTAVHTGEAFVGATGLGTTVEDFTALGDAVNITARLASAAAAGEVIVSVATAAAAGMTTDQLERRTVAIRGRTEPIEVIVLPRPDKAARSGCGPFRSSYSPQRSMPCRSTQKARCRGTFPSYFRRIRTVLRPSSAAPGAGSRCSCW
jgi:adenylate cyclase